MNPLTSLVRGNAEMMMNAKEIENAKIICVLETMDVIRELLKRAA